MENYPPFVHVAAVLKGLPVASMDIIATYGSLPPVHFGMIAPELEAIVGILVKLHDTENAQIADDTFTIGPATLAVGVGEKGHVLFRPLVEAAVEKAKKNEFGWATEQLLKQYQDFAHGRPVVWRRDVVASPER